MRLSYGVDVKFEVHMTLSEGEALALDALVGYGTDAFLKVFYEKMGKSYLEPYEADLRQLFETVKAALGPQLHKIKELRNLVAEQERQRRMDAEELAFRKRQAGH